MPEGDRRLDAGGGCVGIGENRQPPTIGVKSLRGLLTAMRCRSPEAAWTWVAYTTVALLLASVVPSPFRRHPEWNRVGPDKFLHLVGHAGYAVTLANAFGTGRRTDREAAVLAAFVSAGHGVVTGRLQERIPGRAFEPADVVAGLLGSVLAAWGWYALVDARPDPDRST